MQELSLKVIIRNASKIIILLAKIYKTKESNFSRNFLQYVILILILDQRSMAKGDRKVII